VDWRETVRNFHEKRPWADKIISFLLITVGVSVIGKVAFETWIREQSGDASIFKNHWFYVFIIILAACSLYFPLFSPYVSKKQKKKEGPPKWERLIRKHHQKFKNAVRTRYL